MRVVSLFIVLIIISKISVGQESGIGPESQSNRIVFYNVENFFDPYFDSTLVYNEFTQEGDLHWSYKKYAKKRNDIYKTLTAIAGWKPLTVIGLAEIENFLVLYELLEKTPLKNEKYKIVHFESEDHRGIDLGVIYHADLFELLNSFRIRIRTSEDTSFKTRDIIYIKGIMQSDTLHLFYNHWTSRYRGLLESKKYRMLAAQILKSKVDSICYLNPEANILVMGDFNDNPTDESIRYLMHNGNCYLKQLEFSNGNKDVKGTLKYQANWSYFDQALVSESLIKEENNLFIKDNKTYIFDAKFLLETDKKYLGLKPYRTNIGFKYNGGISDHLPIYVDIISNK